MSDLTWTTRFKGSNPQQDPDPITSVQPDPSTQQSTDITKAIENALNYKNYLEAYLQSSLKVLRDKLDTLAKLTYPSNSPTPWFEWNGTNLTQFGTPVVGPSVTSHTESVVTYGGFKWISMQVTASAAATGLRTGVILPIEVLPPSADYVIAFDFVSKDITSDIVGAAAVVRFVDMFTGYYCRYFHRSSGIIQDFGRFDIDYTMTRFQDMNDPYLEGYDRGCRMALSIQGGSPASAGALVKMIVGEPAIYIDTSPHTAVGKAGLFQTNGGVSGTTENYYRNIRCYLSSAVERFEL